MNSYALTIDIDWAPDFIINQVADTLIQHSIKCTWFVTHQSPILSKLKENQELFELGIHPNFLPNSSHGNSPEQVLDFMKSLLPQSKVVRTHALVQSSHLLKLMTQKYEIEIDASLLLINSPHIIPHKIFYDHSGKGLMRMPYFWEDDLEMYTPDKSWQISNPKYHVPGLKIFNFHPLYIYLNGDTMHNYEKLKQKGILYQLDRQAIDPFINFQPGAGSFFLEWVAFIVNNHIKTYTLSEIAAEYYISN